MRVVVTVLLVVAFLMAGCSGSPAPDDDATPTTSGGNGQHGQHEAATHILAPTWDVGDFWTLESPQGSGPFTHAVSGDLGDDWLMDTDSPDIAYFDARFDISFLGKVRKSDLAGSQGSTRVQFLKFPLQQDLEWTTTWDGEAMALQVTQVMDGKATIQSRRSDGSLHAEYVYDSKPGYFTRFTFYAPDGTTVGFEWALRQAGSGFASPLVRWTLEELFSTTGPITSGGLSSFQVNAGYTDIWVDGNLDCTAGAVVLAVGPFTGPAEDRGYSAMGACPLQQRESYPVAAPAQAEQWGAALTSAPTTAGTLDLYIFGRTSVQFNAGQAPQSA